MIACNWLSDNSDTFSVGIPELLVTELPGTFNNRL